MLMQRTIEVGMRLEKDVALGRNLTQKKRLYFVEVYVDWTSFMHEMRRVRDVKDCLLLAVVLTLTYLIK